MSKLNAVFLVMALLINIGVFAQNDTATTQTQPKDSTYQCVDEMAQFPGGDHALFEWLGKNLRYPQAAVDARIEGTVYVKFVVEEDGTLTNVEAFQGVHPILDSAAIEVIQKMPRWIPGKYKGKPVRSVFILPMMFQLPDHGKPSKAAKRRRK